MAIDTGAGVEVCRKLTPDDVEHMFDRGELDHDLNFELVDGEIVELTRAKTRQSRTCIAISSPLHEFAKRSGGWVFDSSVGFRVGPNYSNLRSPDVSYVAPGREPPENGWMVGAPDLAVEVLSDDEYGDAYAKPKVREYLESGGKIVWLVDPRPNRRLVRVYLAGADTYRVFRSDAVLTLEPIIAGFSLAVSDIFG